MSEFGKGFIYNLILFAKHCEAMREYVKNNGDYQLWFNGASDHFYDFEIPEQFKDTPIGSRATAIRDLALDLGHGFPRPEVTENDYKGVFDDVEELAMMIDTALGLTPEKAEYR